MQDYNKDSMISLELLSFKEEGNNFICAPGILTRLEEEGNKEFVSDLFEKLIDIPGFLKLIDFVKSYEGYTKEFVLSDLSDVDYWSFYVQFHSSMAKYIGADFLILPSKLKYYYFNNKLNHGRFFLFSDVNDKSVLRCITQKRFLKKFKLNNKNEKEIKEFVFDSSFKESNVPDCLVSVQTSVDDSILRQINAFWYHFFNRELPEEQKSNLFSNYMELIEDFMNNEAELTQYAHYNAAFESIKEARDKFSNILDYEVQVKSFFHELEKLSEVVPHIDSDRLFELICRFRTLIFNYLELEKVHPNSSSTSKRVIGNILISGGQVLATKDEAQVGEKCPECGGRIIFTPEKAQNACEDCGLVFDERVPLSVERRAHGKEEVERRRHTGDPSAIHNRFKSLSTDIKYSEIKSPAMKRAAKLHKQTGEVSATLANAIKEIKRIAERLNYPKYAEDQAIKICGDAWDKKLAKGFSSQGIVGGCLFYVARDCKLPILIKDITAEANIEKEELFKGLRKLYNELDLESTRKNYESLVTRTLGKLGIKNYNVERKAIELYRNYDKKQGGKGKNPIISIGAAIYLIGIKEGELITKKAIADILDISYHTFRERIKEIESFLDPYSGGFSMLAIGTAPPIRENKFIKTYDNFFWGIIGLIIAVIAGSVVVPAILLTFLEGAYADVGFLQKVMNISNEYMSLYPSEIGFHQFDVFIFSSYASSIFGYLFYILMISYLVIYILISNLLLRNKQKKKLLLYRGILSPFMFIASLYFGAIVCDISNIFDYNEFIYLTSTTVPTYDQVVNYFYLIMNYFTICLAIYFIIEIIPVLLIGNKKTLVPQPISVIIRSSKTLDYSHYNTLTLPLIENLFRKFLFTSYIFHAIDNEILYDQFISFVSKKRKYKKLIAHNLTIEDFEGYIRESIGKYLVFLSKFDIYYLNYVQKLVDLTDIYHYEHNDTLTSEDICTILAITPIELKALTYSLIKNENYYMIKGEKYPEFSLFFKETSKHLNTRRPTISLKTDNKIDLKEPKKYNYKKKTTYIIPFLGMMTLQGIFYLILIMVVEINGWYMLNVVQFNASILRLGELALFLGIISLSANLVASIIRYKIKKKFEVSSKITLPVITIIIHYLLSIIFTELVSISGLLTIQVTDAMGVPLDGLSYYLFFGIITLIICLLSEVYRKFFIYEGEINLSNLIGGINPDMVGGRSAAPLDNLVNNKDKIKENTSRTYKTSASKQGHKKILSETFKFEKEYRGRAVFMASTGRGFLTPKINPLSKIYSNSENQYLISKFAAVESNIFIMPVDRPYLEKELSERITLKAEDGHIYVYIDGVKFHQCMRLLFSIPTGEIEDYAEINSIDEMDDKFGTEQDQQDALAQMAKEEAVIKMTLEEEFYAHASNLEAWIENDYNTNILHKSLSFPILNELSKKKGSASDIRLQEEVSERFSMGHLPVSLYLLKEGYLDDFSLDLFTITFDNFLNNIKILDLKILKLGVLYDFYNKLSTLEDKYKKYKISSIESVLHILENILIDLEQWRVVFDNLKKRGEMIRLKEFQKDFVEYFIEIDAEESLNFLKKKMFRDFEPEDINHALKRFMGKLKSVELSDKRFSIDLFTEIFHLDKDLKSIESSDFLQKLQDVLEKQNIWPLYTTVNGRLKWTYDNGESLSLIGEAIDNLSELGLSRMRQLKTLDLRKNKIKSLKVLGALINLEKLDLSNNEIQDLSGLENLTKLERLNLSKNEIVDLSSIELESLSKLKELDLSLNKIREIPDLSGLKQLESLKLGSNKISEIKGIDGLANLNSLELQNNLITEMKGFTNNLALRRLDLQMNKITELKAVSHLKSLIFLYLKWNNIENVNQGDLPESIERLNIGGNKTKTLDVTGLTNLRELYIEHNNIAEIKGIESLENIERITIKNNPLDEDVLREKTKAHILAISPEIYPEDNEIFSEDQIRLMDYVFNELKNKNKRLEDLNLSRGENIE